MPFAARRCRSGFDNNLSFSDTLAMTNALPPALGGPTASRYLQQLSDLLAQRGVDPQRLLREADLKESDLAPGQWVSSSQLHRFVVAAERLSGDEYLGMLLGKQLNLSSHGAAGMAGLTAPNARATIEVAIRYFALISGELSLSTREEGAYFVIVLRTQEGLPIQSARFLVQTVISSIDLMGGFLLGNHPSTIRVTLAMEEDSAMRDSLGAAITTLEFGRPHNAVYIPLDLLDIPLALADAQAHRQAVANCDQELSALQRQQHFADRVMALLLEAPGAMPGIEELARGMHVSSRTIHRRLRSEGTHFRALLNTARMQRARHLLLSEGRAITETAHLLGYQDSANFTRAFRRETGMSPTEFLARERREKPGR